MFPPCLLPPTHTECLPLCSHSSFCCLVVRWPVMWWNTGPQLGYSSTSRNCLMAYFWQCVLSVNRCTGLLIGPWRCLWIDEESKKANIKEDLMSSFLKRKFSKIKCRNNKLVRFRSKWTSHKTLWRQLKSINNYKLWKENPAECALVVSALHRVPNVWLSAYLQRPFLSALSSWLLRNKSFSLDAKVAELEKLWAGQMLMRPPRT